MNNAPSFTDMDKAVRLLSASGAEAERLYEKAGELRMSRFGGGTHLCGIVNAKSGGCPEDCAFCAQSAHWRTGVPAHAMLDEDALFGAGEWAEREGLNCFGIVVSGRGLDGRGEIDSLCAVFRRFDRARFRFRRALSGGMIREDDLKRLRDSGLEVFHHNLEASRSFYPSICTTRDYDDNVRALVSAREAGLSLCSGGLLGMGESDEQRVELAEALSELSVKSVPLNFLVPVPGTPLSDMNELTPEKCLNIIAVFRLFLPDADIHICGGRPIHLAGLQDRMFSAGASGLMTGDYLTTQGFKPEDDRRLVLSLGLSQRPRRSG